MIRVLIAEWEGEPAGFALYFFNFSTFVGRPGCTSKTCSCVRPCASTASAARCCARWRESPGIAVAGAWSGPCSTGTNPRLKFYKSLDARQMKEWIVHRLTPVEIDKLAAET